MAKRNRTKDVYDGVEEGRLGLALLKENSEYRRFFEEHRSALSICLPMTQEGDPTATFQKQIECSKVIRAFVADCETKFGMAPHTHPLFVSLYFPDSSGAVGATPRKLSPEQVLLFLDPNKDVEEIPKELSAVFSEMFLVEGIRQIVIPEKIFDPMEACRVEGLDPKYLTLSSVVIGGFTPKQVSAPGTVCGVPQ